MTRKNTLDKNLNFEITDASKKNDLLIEVQLVQEKTEIVYNSKNTIIINKSSAPKYPKILFVKKGLKLTKRSNTKSYRTFYLNVPQIKKTRFLQKDKF